MQEKNVSLEKLQLRIKEAEVKANKVKLSFENICGRQMKLDLYVLLYFLSQFLPISSLVVIVFVTKYKDYLYKYTNYQLLHCVGYVLVPFPP